MYKVFINDKAIYFTNNEEIINTSSNCLVVNFFSDKLSDVLVSLLRKNQKIETVFINVADIENAFTIFINNFKLINAAGGVVKNDKEEVLFIYRLGKWDLPKGKIEGGENQKEAAIREVQEECGVSSLNVVKQLADTFHIYELEGELILKQTFWYEMETKFDGQLIPQLEEGITAVVWYSKKEISENVLSDTYVSIKELVLTNVL